MIHLIILKTKKTSKSTNVNFNFKFNSDLICWAYLPTRKEKKTITKNKSINHTHTHTRTRAHTHTRARTRKRHFLLFKTKKCFFLIVLNNACMPIFKTIEIYRNLWRFQVCSLIYGVWFPSYLWKCNKIGSQTMRRRVCLSIHTRDISF